MITVNSPIDSENNEIGKDSRIQCSEFLVD